MKDVLSKGGTGKYENKGVTYLTKYKSMDENAMRLKMTKLSKGQILVLFEKWTGKAFVSSNMVCVWRGGLVYMGKCMCLCMYVYLCIWACAYVCACVRICAYALPR